MKILLIGSGGREHAMAWKLAQSPHTAALWCAPGNAGIAGERLSSNGEPVQCESVPTADLRGLLELARRVRPHLTVVGPDAPLAAGIVDLFSENGFRIWGPNRRAARFEASKAFSQEFMERHGIPTARAGCFSDPQEALRFAKELGGRCAVKADGLALGKGVLLARTVEECEQAIQEILVRRSFGDAGNRLVIQEWLEGIEVSLHAICDGQSYRLFPTAQDHKRALDGDQGLNTGGMGTYSPAPFLASADLETANRTIMDPWLRGCIDEGIDFRGILYPGVMLTAEGPRVLEFNVRFGDPEAQVFLARLETDLVELIEASLAGTLDAVPLRWREESAICVVMASAGYPGSSAAGEAIEGLDTVGLRDDLKVFHAGTALDGDRLVTAGGRVLGVTAWRATLAEARQTAYEVVDRIRFNGAQYRKDIGARATGIPKA